MQTEFGILGPLAVVDGGVPRAVAAAKQRVVLALLLLRAGQAVSADSLAGALWNDRLPATARPSLRNYVMRLRRCLGDAGERIRSHDGGYLIEVGPEELDLSRFTRLYRDGVRAFQGGALAEASDALGRALGQWRGAALADVDSDVVQRDEYPRLAADRLDALELKLSADRGLGRFDTPLGEVRQFALAHPERESLWEHLILALLHHGRGSEAEAAFQQIRRTLWEDFGATPGERLELVHKRMTSTHAPVDAAPFQVPADLADFTGRLDETVAASAVLCDVRVRAARALVLTGPPGIGKTALAIHVAHAVRNSYPDGILYASVQTDDGDPLGPEYALGSFLSALPLPSRVAPDGLADRSALLRSSLAGRRVLLVIDGAVEAAQVRPLLPSTPGSAALITSRLRLDDLAGAGHLELAPFSAVESAQLIGRIAGPARIAAQPQAVRDLLSACGNLPLALRIVASRLAARPAWSVRDLVERLADRDRRLDELRTGRLDLRASLRGSFRSLPSPAAAALPRLATVDRPALTVLDAANVLGMPATRAEQVLECLVDHRFLVTSRPGSYSFPELIRVFAREQTR